MDGITDELAAERLEALRRAADRAPAPIPMFLTCPKCNSRHVDEGDFATKPHHTHSCQACGLTWRPAVVPTVGVAFLPGFKNVATTRGGIPSDSDALADLVKAARRVPIVRRGKRAPWSTCLGCGCTDDNSCKPECWALALEIAIDRGEAAIVEPRAAPMPSAAPMQCFDNADGKPCTRYLEGSIGERESILKWLRSDAPIANARGALSEWMRLLLAEVLEEKGRVYTLAGPSSSEASYSWTDLMAARTEAIKACAQAAVAHGDYFAEDSGVVTKEERALIVGAARAIAQDIRALLFTSPAPK